MSLDKHLNLLEATGLIHLAQVQLELEYVFRHALVQEAAYDSLLRQNRKSLHRAVGEALERLYPDRREEMAGVLAFHFENAEEFGRALEYLILGGRLALRRFAYREARSYFDRAEAILPGDDGPGSLRRRVEVRLLRVESGYTFVPFDQNLALVESILPAAETLADQRLLAQVHLLISRLRHGQGESYSGSTRLRRSLDQALAIGEALQDDSLRALPMGIIGRSMVDVDPRAGVNMLEEAVRVLERLGDLKEASYSSSVLAIVYTRLGEFHRADQLSRQAMDWAEITGDPNALLDAELALGALQAERGKLEEGLALVRSSIAHADEVGNTLCATVGNFYLGDYHLRLGQPEKALMALERSGELALYCDASMLANLSRAWESTARHQLGRAEEAYAGWEAALSSAERMGDWLAAGEIHRQRANALAQESRPDWARIAQGFEESIRIFESIGMRPHLARAMRDYGLALERRDDSTAETAREKLHRAAMLFEELGVSDDAETIRRKLSAMA